MNYEDLYYLHNGQEQRLVVYDAKVVSDIIA